MDKNYFKALKDKYPNLFEATSPIQSIYGKVREVKNTTGTIPEICELYKDYEIYYYGHSTLNGPCPDWYNPEFWEHHRIILVPKSEGEEWIKGQMGKIGIPDSSLPILGPALSKQIKKERSKRLLL